MRYVATNDSCGIGLFILYTKTKRYCKLSTVALGASERTRKKLVRLTKSPSVKRCRAVRSPSLALLACARRSLMCRTSPHSFRPSTPLNSALSSRRTKRTMRTPQPSVRYTHSRPYLPNNCKKSCPKRAILKYHSILTLFLLPCYFSLLRVFKRASNLSAK